MFKRRGFVFMKAGRLILVYENTVDSNVTPVN